MKKRVLTAGLMLGLVAMPTSADAAYAPNRVLVKFDSGVLAARQLALVRTVGATSLGGRINGIGVRVVRVPGNAAAAAAKLDAKRGVRFAEVDTILTASAIPNDPRFGELYGLNNTGQSGGTPDADIDAPEGWDAAGLLTFPATGGPKVGIVDTGIRATHEDLSGKVANCAQSRSAVPLLSGSIQEGSCADDNSHGTHVAGTISANANNARGVAGVAFNSPLAICRALGGPLGNGNTSDVANCITWLKDRGSRVISMSLSGGSSSTLQSAVQYAWSGGNGALLVAASGNDGSNSTTPVYPAGYAEVVSVAATDRRDARASFSNANPDVEIAAPGVDTLSTVSSSDSAYGLKSGTSMATPHVAGAAAVIAGRNPTFNAAAIRTKLQSSVDDKGAAGRDPVFGFGRVNLLKAAT